MINQNQLEQLKAVEGENCISFYIPTRRVDGIQEDKIRYKNMLSTIDKELEAKELSAKEIKKITRTAYDKLEKDEFWQHLSDTLAVFIYDGKTEFHYLPLQLDSYHFIGNKLYLLPALPFTSASSKFYTLALSQNEVRVFEGSSYSLTELKKNSDFPENLAEILRAYDGEKTLQQHGGGNDSTVFHGQGGENANDKARLEEYLRRIDEGIKTMSCDDDKKPLVLYTTPALAGIYRNINTYPHLVEDFAEGNPEDVDMMTIHEKSWKILSPSFEQEYQADMDNFEVALANEQASFDIQTIAPAAMAGQVKTLYLVTGEEVWGKYDAAKHSIEIHPSRRKDSSPLYNDIALAVITQSGTLQLLEREEMPRPTANANAVFHYALATA
jgi:hypothetical protein